MDVDSSQCKILPIDCGTPTAVRILSRKAFEARFVSITIMQIHLKELEVECHGPLDHTEKVDTRSPHVHHGNAYPRFRRSVKEPTLRVQDQVAKDRFTVVNESLFELKGVLRRRVNTDLCEESNVYRSLSCGNELPS